METIDISYFQRQNLCDEIARLVFEYSKNPRVECIYFGTYKNLGRIKGDIVEITIVKKIYRSNIEKQILEYNLIGESKEFVKNNGFKIYLRSDWSEEYMYLPTNLKEEERNNYLFNSVILFDRTGKYREIKSNIEKYSKNSNTNLYQYSNSVIINPSLEPLLASSFPLNKMQGKTLALRKKARKQFYNGN